MVLEKIKQPNDIKNLTEEELKLKSSLAFFSSAGRRKLPT